MWKKGKCFLGILQLSTKIGQLLRRHLFELQVKGTISTPFGYNISLSNLRTKDGLH